jgi:hypothetical protein
MLVAIASRWRERKLDGTKENIKVSAQIEIFCKN